MNNTKPIPGDTKILSETTPVITASPSGVEISTIKETRDQAKLVEMQEQFVKNYESLNKMMDIINGNYYAKSAFMETYGRVLTERREIIKAIEDIKTIYLTQVIVGQFIEDAFTPETKTNEIIRIKASGKNKDLQKELDYLQHLLDFDMLAKDYATEALYYGDYTASTRIEKGKGLVDIIDDVDQQVVVPLVKHSGSAGYLIFDDKTKSIQIVDDSKYVKFTMGGTRIRIKLQEEIINSQFKMSKEITDQIPRYARIGQSIIYPVINKIKDLDLLERLVPKTKLKKLSNGTLVGLQVPAGTSPTEALKFCETVEDIINKKIGVNQDNGYVTAQNIIEAADLFKVVPLYGNIGEVKPMDYHGREPDELLASLGAVRSSILDSVGCPSELIYSSESKDVKKSDIIKRYGRYLRKLKQIQQMVVDGIKQIIYIHLANKDKKKWANIKSTDIDIVFINDLIEIDNLDRLEFLDSTIGFMDNANKFVTGLMTAGSPFAQYIDKAEYIKFLKEQLSTVNLNIIDFKGKGKVINMDDVPGSEVGSNNPPPIPGEENPAPEVPGEETTPPPETPAPSGAPAPGSLLPS